MIATYSEAHRQLDRMLDYFLFACIAEVLIGAVQSNWLFIIVWVAAALMAGFFAAPRGQNVGTAVIARDDELAHEEAFAGKFLKLTNLLAAAILIAGFTLGYPWWANLLVAIVTWFASMFGILLLCAPRIHGEADLAD